MSIILDIQLKFGTKKSLKSRKDCYLVLVLKLLLRFPLMHLWEDFVEGIETSFCFSEILTSAFIRKGPDGFISEMTDCVQFVRLKNKENWNKIQTELISLTFAILSHFFVNNPKAVIREHRRICKCLQYEGELKAILEAYIAAFESFVNIYSDNRQRISDQIIEHLREMPLDDLKQISVSHLADKFGVSLSHLSKTFKIEQGRNLKDVILTTKLNRAFQIITCQKPKPRLDGLARSLGFGDTNYFRKVFKGKFGKSPSQLFR